MENVPSAADAKGAIILASKHQSTWETFAFPVVMPHPLAYVFKKELIYVPFFGWAMARMDMIHIDRSKRTEAWNKVAAQGKRLSALGKWVIMFPEGTRSARGAQGTYKSGATRLAIANGVPVVPIAVDSARCWPRKSFWLKPGVVTISIGKPISPEGPRARRDDARGRGLDRGGDAPARSRGVRDARLRPRRRGPQWPAAAWATRQSPPRSPVASPCASVGDVIERPCTTSVGTPSDAVGLCSWFACCTFVRTPNELNSAMNRFASTPFPAMNAAMSSGLSRRWRSRCTALNTFCCIVSARPIASSAKYIGWKLTAFSRNVHRRAAEVHVGRLAASQASSVGLELEAVRAGEAEELDHVDGAGRRGDRHGVPMAT